MPIEQLTTDRKPASAYAATRAGENAGTVIDIKGLRTYLFTRSGIVKAESWGRNMAAPSRLA